MKVLISSIFLSPAKWITCKENKLELKEATFLKTRQTLANFELIVSNIRKVEKQALVYDTNDVIGAIGGSLGLFLGLSFFNVISKCLDNPPNLANCIIRKQNVAINELSLDES